MIDESFLSFGPSPSQPPLVSGYRYTNRIRIFYVIDATLNDFLGTVALDHGTLWVSTIPYIALENAHVPLKRIHLMQEYRSQRSYLIHDVNQEVYHDIEKGWREAHLKLAQSLYQVAL